MWKNPKIKPGLSSPKMNEGALRMPSFALAPSNSGVAACRIRGSRLCAFPARRSVPGLIFPAGRISGELLLSSRMFPSVLSSHRGVIITLRPSRRNRHRCVRGRQAVAKAPNLAADGGPHAGRIDRVRCAGGNGSAKRAPPGLPTMLPASGNHTRGGPRRRIVRILPGQHAAQ